MKKNAIITGVTTGIGYELANILAENSYSIVLIGRDHKRLIDQSIELRERYNVSVQIIPKDLSKQNSAKEIYDEVRSKNLTIDVLVNNAGFALAGKFHETDIEKELQLIQVNIVSLITLTKYFLQDMLNQKHGKILNVASTVAFQPGPHIPIYAASKAFVLSFSDALNSELKNTGISVTTLCPGATKTQLYKTANWEPSWLIKSTMMDAKDVAREGFEALIKGKALVMPGFLNKVLSTFIKVFPRQFVISVAKYLIGGKKNNEGDFNE